MEEKEKIGAGKIALKVFKVIGKVIYVVFCLGLAAAVKFRRRNFTKNA